jgi:hypothetical protein
MEKRDPYTLGKQLQEVRFLQTLSKATAPQAKTASQAENAWIG